MFKRTLQEIADLLDGNLNGPGDLIITGLAGLEDAGPGDLSFARGRAISELMPSCKAGALLVPPGVVADCPAIEVPDPHVAFVHLLKWLEPDQDRIFPPGIHSSAVVASSARLGSQVALGPGCVLGPDVTVGDGTRLGPQVVLEAGVCVGEDCRLYSGVVVRYGCRLGDRVVVHPRAVIGSDGFGFLPGPDGLQKIPQVGIAVLEDDVEVGAGACVDRAKVGRTVVGRGTKIDNLVQIGHNVKIGPHCALSAQVGIAGTAILGQGVTAGGQVGIGDHLHVGDGARLGGQSGIWRDVPAGETVFGTPALNIKESFRITGAMRRLPELLRRMRRERSGDLSPEEEQE